MPRLWNEFRFLLVLWKANFLSAMEYRIPFISQVIGMMLNNGVYFVIWVIYFDRFKVVRGWELNDMMLLFGVVACGYGLGMFLFGNAMNLAEIIANSRLDYYLSLPHPVLLHALASHSVYSGLGDFTYGLLSFIVAGQFGLESIGRFVLGVLASAVVLVSFLVLVQSLAFWLGNSQMIGYQAFQALITFSLYPITLFDGPAKFFLFTIIPAALMGALPAEFVRSFSWSALLQMLGGAGLLFFLSVLVFYRGLRRYESGSAIQTQV